MEITQFNYDYIIERNKDVFDYLIENYKHLYDFSMSETRFSYYYIIKNNYYRCLVPDESFSTPNIITLEELKKTMRLKKLKRIIEDEKF